MNLCGQRFSLGDVVDLAAGQSERERVSQRVDDHMDFRGQPPRERPMAWLTPFFCAPRRCADAL